MDNFELIDTLYYAKLPVLEYLVVIDAAIAIGTFLYFFILWRLEVNLIVVVVVVIVIVIMVEKG